MYKKDGLHLDWRGPISCREICQSYSGRFKLKWQVVGRSANGRADGKPEIKISKSQRKAR